MRLILGSPLGLHLPVLVYSVQAWHAPARFQGFQSSKSSPSRFWHHSWDSSSRPTMSDLRNQGSDAPRNQLDSAPAEVTANLTRKEEFAEPKSWICQARGGGLSSAPMADEQKGNRNLEAQLTPRVCRVAVVGAGAAGLVAARELCREGHEVVVYEQNDQVGGVWVYTAKVEDDLLGIQPDRSRIHGSMYESLRTNLPRELMGFLDFPFLPVEGRDTRRFPNHQEVQLYLEDFAKEFDILRLVRFNTVVESVSLKKGDDQIVRSVQKCVVSCLQPDMSRNSEVRSRDSNCSVANLSEQLARPNFDGIAPEPGPSLEASYLGGESRGLETAEWVIQSRGKAWTNGSRDQPEVGGVIEDVFDAVVLCNGHYSEPKIASIPGIERWSGRVMHSHNYRVPSSFQGQVVVVVGSAASGEDISREVATVAKEVHICARAWSPALDLSKPDAVQGNLWRHTMIACISKEGAVRFEDGSEVYADTIMHCTGYKYSFPFLRAQVFITVEDNRVGPLFQHVFPPALAPHLSFVGLPYKVVPFPLCELQSKWIAKILSGKLSLPSSEQMTRAVHNFYLSLENHAYPKHYTHNMDLYQYPYSYWLAEQCGYEIDRWREEMYAAGRDSKRLYPTKYRDVWTDQQLMNEVYSNLLQFQSGRVGPKVQEEFSSITNA